ncbi:MAG: hypothetical protein HY841_03020 [Bacteroidetes bacterium]|nr:hypothetical protein [Bacteroidota bacterium]
MGIRLNFLVQDFDGRVLALGAHKNYKGEYRLCAMCKQPAVQDFVLKIAVWVKTAVNVCKVV